MPRTEVIFHREGREAPVVAWLEELRRDDPGGFARCAALLVRLAAEGRGLRPPAAEPVRGGIFALRARWGGVGRALLYAFDADPGGHGGPVGHGGHALVLGHVVGVREEVPQEDLVRSIERLQAFRDDPTARAHREPGAAGPAGVLEVLGRIVGPDDALRHLVAEETLRSRIASAVRGLRERAGLTREELAARAGTQSLVIARIEEAHARRLSFPLLVRLAEGLGRRLDVRLLPDDGPRR